MCIRDRFRVRCAVTRGESRRVDTVFPEGIATRALRAKEVFWSDDVRQLAGANLEVLAQYEARQLLAVPLLGADGKVLGMFGVLDRLDETGISQQDIRRARALAAQVSVVLEVAHNLHQSERHRKRSEALTQLAREIDGLLRLPDLAGKFVERAIALAGAHAGAVALFQDGRLQIVALHPLPPAANTSPDPPDPDLYNPDLYNPDLYNPDLHNSDLHNPDHPSHDTAGNDHTAAPNAVAIRAEDRVLPQRFAQALSELAAKRPESIVSGAAAELLDPDLALSLGWHDLVVVRLPAPNGDLAGLLCLSGRARPLAAEDRDLLEAIAGHAAMALENARLFTRIEQSNRHWLEIFDAITDLSLIHISSHFSDHCHHVCAAARAL